MYLYKFETLVPFEVLPLRLDAVIPAPLPTEMLSRAASEPLAALDIISVGSGAGITASSRGGSTSKGTKVSNLYKYINFFNNSGNIWVPPRIRLRGTMGDQNGPTLGIRIHTYRLSNIAVIALSQVPQYQLTNDGNLSITQFPPVSPKFLENA